MWKKLAMTIVALKRSFGSLDRKWHVHHVKMWIRFLNILSWLHFISKYWLVSKSLVVIIFSITDGSLIINIAIQRLHGLYSPSVCTFPVTSSHGWKIWFARLYKQLNLTSFSLTSNLMMHSENWQNIQILLATLCHPWNMYSLVFI